MQSDSSDARAHRRDVTRRIRRAPVRRGFDRPALADRLYELAARARRLPPPSHRTPEAFHEARDELGADIETLAHALRVSDSQ